MLGINPLCLGYPCPKPNTRYRFGPPKCPLLAKISNSSRICASTRKKSRTSICISGWNPLPDHGRNSVELHGTVCNQALFAWTHLLYEFKQFEFMIQHQSCFMLWSRSRSQWIEPSKIWASSVPTPTQPWWINEALSPSNLVGWSSIEFSSSAVIQPVLHSSTLQSQPATRFGALLGDNPWSSHGHQVTCRKTLSRALSVEVQPAAQVAASMSVGEWEISLNSMVDHHSTLLKFSVRENGRYHEISLNSMVSPAFKRNAVFRPAVFATSLMETHTVRVHRMLSRLRLSKNDIPGPPTRKRCKWRYPLLLRCHSDCHSCHRPWHLALQGIQLDILGVQLDCHLHMVR